MSVRTMLSRWRRTPPRPLNPYWLLSFVLFALLAYIVMHFVAPGSDRDPYAVGVVILMVVFQQLDRLAHESKWPGWLAVALALLSLGWTAFTVFYLLYWSRILYP